MFVIFRLAGDFNLNVYVREALVLRSGGYEVVGGVYLCHGGYNMDWGQE